MRAYVAIYDLSGEYPKELLCESFECIGDLPEHLQFMWWWFDDYGEIYTCYGRGQIDEDPIIRRREQLGLCELGNALTHRIDDSR
jgi:hypothetical protein